MENYGIPETISNAAKLIYASLAIGIVNSVIMEISTSYNNISDPQNLIITVLSVGIIAFLAYKISFGKKWARTTFLVRLLLDYSVTHLL